MDVVTIGSAFGRIALARPWGLGLRATESVSPAELEPALREALADVALRPALLGLVGPMAPGLAEQALLEAVAERRLVALRLPGRSMRGRRVREGQPPEGLPEIVHLSQPALGLAQAALAEARPGAAATDPLFGQAALVLAAWAQQGWVEAGAAMVAIEAVCRPPPGGAAALEAACQLREAARRLGAEAADAAVPLRAAAERLGWPGMLAVLAQMTPDFVWRMPPMPAGGGGDAPAEAPSAPAAMAAPPPPDPSELPGVDEALMAEMLREAAKNGTPFCIPCMAAA